MRKVTLFIGALLITINCLKAQDSTGLSQTIHTSNILDNFSGLKSYFVATSFRPVENTVGSPYLYPDWGHLWLDSMENKAVKYSVVYEGNLDLEKNMLIIKAGDSKAFAPETNDIQAFHLRKDDMEQSFVSVKADGVSKFMQRLSAGKYWLVKDIKVKLERSNFEDKGMVQTGKKYDEYKREANYYLLKDGVPVKVTMKKKSFLASLGKDPKALATAKKFLDTYDSSFDEKAMVGAVDAINHDQD
ncbi:hypothetical protein [Chitinophaga sp. MM2321]|uniref:hypothetical protein n=1 Tax=Chitinophaga sp. MM2321 TaxID=3137178 RepID=UPI0032D56C4C